MKLEKLFPKEWGKEIIAGLSVAFLSWLGAIIWSSVEGTTFQDAIAKLIRLVSHSFSVPFYYFLAFGLVIYLFFKIRNAYFGLQNTIIGKYRFRELYDILSTEYVRESTVGMGWAMAKPPSTPLLDQFANLYPTLSNGIDFNFQVGDNGYIYGILCPRLVGFDLMNVISTTDAEINVTMYTYTVSENGKLFWSILNRLTLNDRRRELRKGQF